MTTGEAPAAAEFPLLETCGGWPRDLLTWVVAIPPLLYFGGVAAGFVGITAFVLVLLLFPHVPTLALACAGTAFAITWYRWAREHFGVTAERQTFFSDRVEAELWIRDPGKRRELGPFVIPYSRVGTVLLKPNAGVRLRFDIPSVGRRSSLDVNLPPLIVRDQFDEIVHWIESAGPDHLFLTEADRKRHYSRPWELAEVFPDHRSILGECLIDSLDDRARLVVADKTYAVRFDTFSRAQIIPAPTRSQESEPAETVLAGVCTQTTAAPRVRLIARGGLEIGFCDLGVIGNEIVIELGYGRTITWGTRSGDIRVDGEPIGSLRSRKTGAVLNLDRALPEPEVLAIFLLACFFPQLIRLLPRSTPH